MKLNLLEKIAYFWYKNIDVNGLIYISLKTIPFYIRYILYVLLIVSFSFSINLFIDLLFSIFSKYDYIRNSIPNIGSILNILKYFSIILISTIVTYECLFKHDISLLVEEKRKEKLIVKSNKSQWWRLRNRGKSFRISFYFIIGFICSQLIYIYYLNYVFKFFNVSYGENSFNIHFNSLQEKILFQNNFEQGLNNLMFFALLIYITLIILSEIFIYKRKKKIL